MRVRWIAAALTLALCFSLAACGHPPVSEEQEQELPTLRIGSDDYEPYSYLDETGDFIGIDVDLAREACRRLGYRPEFHQVVWENKDQELAAGNIDSRQMVLVQADSDIATLADLAGKRVAVQATSKPETVFLERPEPERVPKVGEVYCFSSMEEVYSAIRKSFVDAIAGHEGAMRTFMEDSPGSWRILDQSLLVSGLGVAFPKGTNESLSAQLTAVLQEMQKDGTTKAIVEKYGFDPDQFFLGRGGSS